MKSIRRFTDSRADLGTFHHCMTRSVEGIVKAADQTGKVVRIDYTSFGRYAMVYYDE